MDDNKSGISYQIKPNQSEKYKLINIYRFNANMARNIIKTALKEKLNESKYEVFLLIINREIMHQHGQEKLHLL